MGAVKNRRNRHAKKRAEQRYNVLLNREDRRIIATKIRDNNSIFIGRTTNTKSIHLVKHKDEEYIAVYSSSTNCLVTFLPKDCRVYKQYLESKVAQNESKTTPTAEKASRRKSNIDNRFDVEYAERMLGLPDAV